MNSPGTLANAVTTAAYLAICLSVTRGLWRSGQWRNNPLGLATAAIFFTCAVGHGSHIFHPQYAHTDGHPSASDGTLFDLRFFVTGWDVVTATVGIWYWTLRSRFPALVRGAALFEDLRLREATQQTLRESEERYRGIVETTTNGVVLLDRDGQVAYCNAQFAAIVGAMPARSPVTTAAAVPPAADRPPAAVGPVPAGSGPSAEGHAEGHAEAARMGWLPAPAWATAPKPYGPGPDDTDPAGAALLGTPFTELVVDADQAEIAAELEAVRAGAVRRVEVGLRHAGSRKVCAQVALTARIGPAGTVDGMLAMVADVTEQKNIEAQLRQAQRLDALGQLAGGVAHDFNNLLTVIDGYAALVLSRDDLDDGVRSDLTAVRDAANRATGLTGQLLAFSRTVDVRPGPVDLNDLVRGLEEMLRRLIREDIDLVVAAAPEPATVRVDRGQLEQVLVNLVVNSRDAMPDGGRLTIRVDLVDDDRSALPATVDLAGPVVPGCPEASGNPGAAGNTGTAGNTATAGIAPTAGNLGAAGIAATAGNADVPPVPAPVPPAPVPPPVPRVRLTVADTGHGMPDEIRSRIFEPFFTTKPEGTGLGLATVYGIVRQADGCIEVDSAPGVGTTFRVTLPAVVTDGTGARLPTADPASEAATGEITPAARDSETILLAEDDADVRHLGERILRSAGYRVFSAADGLAAMDLARRLPSIDVLVTDVIMPGRNGRQLADELTSMFPGVPVVFTSAYSRGMLADRSDDAGISYLAKPFTAAALTGTVRAALVAGCPVPRKDPRRQHTP